MTKPTLILDAHWRRIDELFSQDTLAALHDRFDIVWGKDAPIPDDLLAQALPHAFAYVAATPRVTGETLRTAPKLKLVAEMSGQFPLTIDYGACQARGVEVLSCAPGFRQSVAEMGVAMALALGRGLVRENEAFRTGDERWLDDCPGEDRTLFGASLGFVGYGSIAREVHRLLAPFGPHVSAYDPWLPGERAREAGIALVDLPDLMARTHWLFITAPPTRQNRHMVGGDHLAMLPDGASVVLISRAYLVDFQALLAEAASGRIKAAIDVFPHEPVAPDDPMRKLPNVLFSPHRAAAVEGGRHLIGDLLLNDLDLILDGKPPRHLTRAAAFDTAAVAGVGDATSVVEMASQRA